MGAPKRNNPDDGHATGNSASPKRSKTASQKTSTRATPTVPKLPFGENNPQQGVADALCQLINGVPLHKLVNLTAAKLFNFATVSRLNDDSNDSGRTWTNLRL